MSKNKCDHCDACKNCELIELGNLLDEACTEFVHIHNTTMDSYAQHKMYQAAIAGKTLASKFRLKVKQIGLNF